MSRTFRKDKALQEDLRRLQSRAYGVADWAGDALRRYHACVPRLAPEESRVLAPLHEWIFVPLTLWPFSITDLLSECISIVEKGKPLTARLRLIIELLPPVPHEEVCAAVADHERQVQRGNYEDVVNTQAKFAQAEL
ncbi:MAG TPA: hypothetical protein PLP58_22285, partial [Prosthecobacter sp.]|nr:hypothetical protein [Prosthecobacter sp.]